MEIVNKAAAESLAALQLEFFFRFSHIIIDFANYDFLTNWLIPRDGRCISKSYFEANSCMLLHL